MGETAEMMIDGTLCQECGVFLNDEPPGHPVTCGDCLRSWSKPTAATAKVACPTCRKMVKQAGLRDHMRDKHADQLSR